MQKIFAAENLLDFPVNENASPTQKLPILVRGKTFPRSGVARWGLLPSHASHDDKILAAKLKNARSETILEKKSFSDLWHKGRKCIVPASGFYEWPEEKIKGHPGYSISVQSGTFGMAGLWNKTEEILTFTILTCEATSSLRDIHSRMPVMFSPQASMEWLFSDIDPAYTMMRRDNITEGFMVEERAASAETSSPLLF